MVKEWLRMSGDGFPHLWDLHKALFYMEMITYAETNYGFVRKNDRTTSLNFERQDFLTPYPVCVQLPDTLGRMVAAREIRIDRSPMFPFEKRYEKSRYYLRFSRPVLLKDRSKEVKISEARRNLMREIIAFV